MSDTPAAEATVITDPAPAVPLRAQLADLILRERLIARAGEEVKALRVVIEKAVIEDYTTNGTRGIDVVVGDDNEKAATVSVRKTTDKAEVTDRGEFTQWVTMNLPAGSVALEAVVAPAVEKGLLKTPVSDGDNNVLWANPATGEMVPIPGVKFTKGGEPTGMSIGQKDLGVLDAAIDGHANTTLSLTATDAGDDA